MTTKRIRLRYKGVCSACQCDLPSGTRGWWDSESKSATCTECRPPESAGSESAEVPTEAPPLPPLPPLPMLQSPDHQAAPAEEQPRSDVAGASAQKLYEQKHRRREQKIEENWGRLSGVVKFLADDPQSTKAWAKGSEGERRLAAHLVRVVGDRAVLLHDRRIPRSSANIDHIAIAASGIWIIDAKLYKGKVEQRDVGGWTKKDLRLYVNGRDKSKLVAGMARQVNAVLEAIGDADVPVNTALCFVESDWGLFGKPFLQGGVWVTWAKKLCEMIAAPGPLAPDRVIAIGDLLASKLPPAA